MSRQTVSKRPGLFGGLLFLYVGVVFLLAKMGYLSNAWTFIGRYWPLLLILAGLAKTVEYLTGGSSKLFRWGEVFLVLLLILCGQIINKAAPFLDSLPKIIDWDRGSLSLLSYLKEPFSFQEDRILELKQDAVLVVTNQRGDISVLPVADGPTKVRIHRQAYAETEEEARKEADKLQPTILQDGNQTRITVDPAEGTRCRLEVLAPPQSTLLLESGNGNISAEGITGKNHSFRTLHGRIQLSAISGGLTATNQNGRIVVADLTGPVSLTTSHGSLEASRIHGDLSVSNENSSVELSDIDGNVILTTRHGSVSVYRARGKVDVTAPQSKVILEEIQGPVQVEASQREVRITRVSTSVEVKQKYGSLHLERIGGAVKVSLEHTEFNGFDLQGGLQAEAEYSEIHLEKTTGPLHVRNRLKPVTIEDFSSSIQVENENAAVYLSSSEPVQQPVRVRTDHGKIEFVQPENSRFRLSATTQTGRIVSDFSEFLPPKGDHNLKTLQGELGSGGPMVTLESIQGSIWIKKKF
jgi:DUF4097 and DUF4098 domain-containing protein YvlB